MGLFLIFLENFNLTIVQQHMDILNQHQMFVMKFIRLLEMINKDRISIDGDFMNSTWNLCIGYWISLKLCALENPG